jgi:hypothetical protein
MQSRSGFCLTGRATGVTSARAAQPRVPQLSHPDTATMYVTLSTRIRGTSSCGGVGISNDGPGGNQTVRSAPRIVRMRDLAQPFLQF